jgi:6-phosphogluconate dehydrogenase
LTLTLILTLPGVDLKGDRGEGEKREEEDAGNSGYVLDKILDQTGMKGTGRWTIQEAAERSVPAPTIAAALDARLLSARKEERLVEG